MICVAEGAEALGPGGKFTVESVATLAWNQWQLSRGIRKPLSGNSSDSPEFGHIVRDHIAQLHHTYGTTYLVADRARSA